MAIKGLSKPVFASYANSSGTVTYTDVAVGDCAVEYSVSWKTTDTSSLYADNGIKETETGKFQYGEIKLKTSDMPQALAKRILGVKTATVTKGGTGTAGIYDDDLKTPMLGFGIVELHQMDDVDKYRAVFFPKAFFNVPDNSATTMEDKVSWQTPEVSGQIMRSDATDTNLKHPWMIDIWEDSEDAALQWLEKMMDKTA